MADALLWILVQFDGVDGLHYLDDFLLFGDPNSPQCEVSLRQALARCTQLGVLVAPGKTEGSSTRFSVFGH